MWMYACSLFLHIHTSKTIISLTRRMLSNLPKQRRKGFGTRTFSAVSYSCFALVDCTHSAWRILQNHHIMPRSMKVKKERELGDWMDGMRVYSMDGRVEHYVHRWKKACALARKSVGGYKVRNRERRRMKIDRNQ